jgi:hypothetical protein
MTDIVIDLDDPKALDARTVLQKTILCWEDFPSKELSLAGHEVVVRPKPGQPQRDACGEGTGVYMLTKPQMAWKQFPVRYHVDPTNCANKDKIAVTAAIVSSFAAYNEILKRNAFQQTTDKANAKIKIFWASHDGPLGQLAVCNYFYYPTKGELISSTVKFDQSDSWYVNPALQCGYTNAPFDIQNCAAHELGHALGLSHVYNDPLSTMFPTLKRGETLRRSLDAGTTKAIKYLYNIT